VGCPLIFSTQRASLPASAPTHHQPFHQKADERKGGWHPETGPENPWGKSPHHKEIHRLVSGGREFDTTPHPHTLFSIEGINIYIHGQKPQSSGKLATLAEAREQKGPADSKLFPWDT
jgi:hypothetical protein